MEDVTMTTPITTPATARVTSEVIPEVEEESEQRFVVLKSLTHMELFPF